MLDRTSTLPLEPPASSSEPVENRSSTGTEKAQNQTAKALAILAAEPDPPDFDWASDDSVVLREQPATAVYFNREGSLVIRQCGTIEDDVCIFITAQNIGDFIDRLCDIAGIGSAGRQK